MGAPHFCTSRPVEFPAIEIEVDNVPLSVDGPDVLEHGVVVCRQKHLAHIILGAETFYLPT